MPRTEKAMSRWKSARRIAAAMLVLLAVAGPAFATDTKTVGGLLIYLGVMPAAIVGHPPPYPEPSIPGKPLPGHDEYHVIVALFEAGDGKRVIDARVSARVSGVGGRKKRLEPMQVGDTLAYGNYFTMTGPGPFLIRLTLRRPGKTGEIRASFDHWY